MFQDYWNENDYIRLNFVWKLILIATIVAFWIVWEDLCSLQRETSERKLVKISGEWFCHNNGIKKAYWKFAADCGGHAIVLVEITAVRQRAGPYCLKEDPLPTPMQLKAALSFFTVVGCAGVPATLHARSASFIFSKIETSLPFRKINS